MLARSIVLLFAVHARAENRELLNRRLGALKCDDDFASLKAGSTCTTTWKQLTQGTSRQLLPTEPSVGYAWVMAQKQRHFADKKDSEKWFGKHTLPVVLNGENFYLTDHHHHALAIQQTDEEIWNLDLTLFVECDLRALSGDAFWSEMQKRNYNLLIDRPRDSPYALPTVITPSGLPSQLHNLTAFTDNKWRSLAGFASHYEDSSGDESKRCYVKPCVAFVDYQWGYAMNYAVEVNTSLWPEGSDVTAFKSMFEALPYQPSPSAVDLDSWAKVGEAVLPLCHSPSLNGFKLPSSLSFPSPTLQGWSAVPLPDDPDCEYKACSSTDAIVV